MLDDLRDILLGIIVMFTIGALVIGGTCFCVEKVTLHLTREKIKIYQEANIIDENTKKIMIEKLDI